MGVVWAAIPAAYMQIRRKHENIYIKVSSASPTDMQIPVTMQHTVCTAFTLERASFGGVFLRYSSTGMCLTS